MVEKGGIRKFSKVALLICTLTLFAPVFTTVVLMQNRPIVSVGRPPKIVPANWICGRVYTGPYCVKVSQQDRTMRQLSFLIALIFGVPALLIQIPETLRRQRLTPASRKRGF